MKPISMLPNTLTLCNAACGMLAVSKGIDALAYAGDQPDLLFYRSMETACFLIFAAMVFDTLDGWVARLTKSHSPFGAELDSLSDAVSFGVAPALLAKILIEHEGPLIGWLASPRLHFAAAACFALLAILRLARFNLETEPEKAAHEEFRGLPSPGAAGAVTSTLWLYLVLRKPELEFTEGTPTPLGRVMGWMRGFDWQELMSWVPAYLLVLLPVLGLLMVSHVRYVHMGAFLTRERSSFFTLVLFVFGALGLFLAPLPVLFLTFNLFVWGGLTQAAYGRFVTWRNARAQRAGART